MSLKPKNDPNAGVTRFCRSLEEHRRTDAGRVKTPKEFVEYFFKHDATNADDRLFPALPREVRGPIISTWGVRGPKSALQDDDERVREVIHDALLAGDVDEGMFEDGVGPSVLIDWISLPDWWTFWRAGRITGAPVQRALAFAREIGLFDDRWFLDHLRGRGGRLSGSDVVCDTLPKDQIIGWIRNVHASGDGTPAGLVSAIGWDVILSKTSQEALLYALDAFAQKVGLSAPAPAPAPSTSATGEVSIPDFSVSEMPPAAEDDPSWPDSLAPAGSSSATATHDEADED